MHVLQGLDVIVFATVKWCLSNERDTWERETGEKISKTNFLGIYGRAHLHALTPNNIEAAFHKTGVWPFDLSVITHEMMAASKETSCEGQLTKLLQNLTICEGKIEDSNSESIRGDVSEREFSGGDDNNNNGSNSGGDRSDGDDNSSEEENSNHGKIRGHWFADPDAIRDAIKDLSKGALAALVSSEPMTSGTEMNHDTTYPISPTKPPTKALSITPKTPNEVLLLAALCEANAQEESSNESLKCRVIELQAANILNEAYCSRICSQLAHQEDKGKKTKGKGKLLGDGLLDWLQSGSVWVQALFSQT